MSELFDDINSAPLQDTNRSIKQDRPKAFERQLVMLTEISEIQLKCQHRLTQLQKETIICTECGALWLK
jgi:hypothetical protein